MWFSFYSTLIVPPKRRTNRLGAVNEAFFIIQERFRLVNEKKKKKGSSPALPQCWFIYNLFTKCQPRYRICILNPSCSLSAPSLITPTPPPGTLFPVPLLQSLLPIHSLSLFPLTIHESTMLMWRHHFTFWSPASEISRHSLSYALPTTLKHLPSATPKHFSSTSETSPTSPMLPLPVPNNTSVASDDSSTYLLSSVGSLEARKTQMEADVANQTCQCYLFQVKENIKCNF